MEPLVVQGRYEVIRRLAIGGMGEIFLARQTGMAGFRRLVILKTLRPELAEQEGFLDQFLDEARLAATLNHPNIVAIYEVGAFPEPRGGVDVHFIAMEYIGGIDLSVLHREAARAGTPLPHRVAAAIVAAAAVGLDYAHHARDEAGKPLGIVHRDVSPQNLMIRPDGVVKVVDFGVAQATTQMHETAADRIKGKIRYMAPEQLSGEDLDGRCDQFSLGIVLWELLVGKPLFSSNNPVDVFQRIVTGDVQRPRQAKPDVPEALDAIVARMMATARDARYPRLSEAAAALRAHLDATGGGAEDELSTFVTSLAGDQIAERVKDLTPRAVSMSAQVVVPSMEPGVDTQAATRVMKGDASSPSKAAETSVETPDRTATVQIARTARHEDGSPLEASDAFLSAVEHSGVLHGARKLLTILVGQLPGWGALAAKIAGVPMGAFAVSRLKNLLLRQLEQVAKEQGGVVVAKSTERFVIAFGVEESKHDDAERALACAFAVRALLADLGRDPRQQLSAHMGVAGGLCLVQDDDGALQIGGAPLDAAEELASRAQQAGATLYAASGIGQLCHATYTSKALDGFVEIEGPRAPGAATIERAAIKRVLIADDADVFRKIEEEILRPYDFAFLHAKDGAQAVKLAVEHKPDLVLLDVQMPVMDGVQVLSFLKKNPATKDIPVVIITTIGRAHDEQLMMKGGASAFLTKPVKPASLVAVVKKLLSI